MKKFMLLLSACFIAAVVSAQSQELSTIVLKSGLRLQGTIAEQSENELTFKTPNGDTFIYRNDEISSIILPGRVDEEQKQPEESPRATKHKVRYKGIAEIGAGSSLQFTFTNGVQVAPYFYAGIGVGLNCWLPEESLALPIFGDMRASFLNSRKLSPYVGMKLGYNVFLLKGYSYYGDSDTIIFPEGIFIEPSAGFSINLKKKTGLTIGLALPCSKVLYHIYLDGYWDAPYDYVRRIQVNVVAKVGISF